MGGQSCGCSAVETWTFFLVLFTRVWAGHVCWATFRKAVLATAGWSVGSYRTLDEGMVMMARAGLAIVTFLSWMVNECQDAFRHSADPGSEQEDQHVVCQRVRRVFSAPVRELVANCVFWAPRCPLEPYACGRGVLALQVHLCICTRLGSRKVCLAFLNDLEVIPVVECLKCRHWQNSPVSMVIGHVWYVGPKGHLSGNQRQELWKTCFFQAGFFCSVGFLEQSFGVWCSCTCGLVLSRILVPQQFHIEIFNFGG